MRMSTTLLNIIELLIVMCLFRLMLVLQMEGIPDSTKSELKSAFDQLKVRFFEVHPLAVDKWSTEAVVEAKEETKLPDQIRRVLDSVEEPIDLDNLMDWSYDEIGADQAGDYQREIYLYLKSRGMINESISTRQKNIMRDLLG